MMSNTHTINETLMPNKPYPADARLRAGRAGQLFRPGDGGAPLGAGEGPQGVRRAAKSKPGELNYASSGPGTPYHMAGELFKAMSGTDIVHVPYKGSGEARTDVIGGHVQMMIDAITTMAPIVTAGQVKALGTTGANALDGAARRADRRRGRRARLRGHHLARHHGAGRDAQGRSSTSSTPR